MLAIITKMTLTQVSTWFANARRRLKKENKMTWAPRNKSEDEDEDDGDGERKDERPDKTMDNSEASAEDEGKLLLLLLFVIITPGFNLNRLRLGCIKIECQC